MIKHQYFLNVRAMTKKISTVFKSPKFGQLKRENLALSGSQIEKNTLLKDGQFVAV